MAVLRRRPVRKSHKPLSPLHPYRQGELFRATLLALLPSTGTDTSNWPASPIFRKGRFVPFGDRHIAPLHSPPLKLAVAFTHLGSFAGVYLEGHRGADGELLNLVTSDIHLLPPTLSQRWPKLAQKLSPGQAVCVRAAPWIFLYTRIGRTPLFVSSRTDAGASADHESRRVSLSDCAIDLFPFNLGGSG